MAAKNDKFETALLKWLFNQTVDAGFTGIFGTPGTPLANFFIALHIGDPGETAANQSISECTYTGYARITAARGSGYFTVAGNTVVPVANIDFPACTAGTETATHFSIGTTVSGSGGVILYVGTITPNIAISAGVIPRLTTATNVSED